MNTQRNHILSAFSPEELELIQPHLEPVEFSARRSLEQPGRPIEWVYFPDHGVASVVATAKHGRTVEVGIIGRDGMTGLSLVLGAERAANEIYIQVGGSGLRIRADDLRQLMANKTALQSRFLLYAHAFMLQTSYTSLASASAKLEERLARWLLMVHDRLDGDEIPLTHELLSAALAVRRAGVTTALQHLHLLGLTEAKRGRVVIRDRAGLERFAGDIYRVPEAETRRLTGWNGLHANTLQ
jgi:CRP-like cAMP-binding protein